MMKQMIQPKQRQAYREAIESITFISAACRIPRRDKDVSISNDAWVVGDEPVVIDISGMANYAAGPRPNSLGN
jgi:hypothetical protein